MRIKLQKGKQKELIYLAKERLSWSELSKKIGVPQQYLSNDLRIEKILISEKIYNKLCKICGKNFNEFIIRRLDDNWGRAKGGINSNGTLINLKIPLKDERLAEFVGAVLGDGNVHLYKKGKKVRVYIIRISGDYKKDEDYHLDYLKNLCKKIFNLDTKENISLKYNGRCLNLYSKELVKFFIQMGINPGNKIKNQSTIPLWIFKKNSYLKACLRGLIDTDGSIFKMSNKDPCLIRISFINYNSQLLEDTRGAFIKLGFHPSKIINKKRFYISRQMEIKKYLKEIGFSNKKHINRLKQIQSPMV